METRVSRDGTRIAFDRIGRGAPLILVVGAFNLRATGEPLATALATDHTVFTYDRRGRGGSTDTPPYAVARESKTWRRSSTPRGGSAAVFGYSSGAILGSRRPPRACRSLDWRCTRRHTYRLARLPTSTTPRHWPSALEAGGAARPSSTSSHMWSVCPSQPLSRCAPRRFVPRWRRWPTPSCTRRRFSALARCRRSLSGTSRHRHSSSPALPAHPLCQVLLKVWPVS